MFQDLDLVRVASSDLHELKTPRIELDASEQLKVLGKSNLVKICFGGGQVHKHPMQMFMPRVTRILKILTFSLSVP